MPYSSTTYREESEKFKKPIAIITLVAVFIVALVGLSLLGSLVENVDAHEIVVVQAPFSGKLSWYTNPGMICQCFGKVTQYPKQFRYETQSSVRFNDGGTADLTSSIQIVMPLDSEHLTELHTRFGSAQAIEDALVAKVTNKAVTMTAPIMSSRESYAEKKNSFISYVEDQIANGIYKTIQKDGKVIDALTGQEKTSVIVEIATDAQGQAIRQERSAIAEYGMSASNYSLDKVKYDPKVEQQIEEQQKITMAVQTSIAEARQAEQRKLTVEQQGQAAAAQAKWEQEVIKAKEVTAAEQRLAVAKLQNQTADQYREETLKRADADSTARRRLMEADGALDQKLKAYVQINQVWAEAFKSYPGQVVPSVVMGGGQGQGNAATTFMDLLGAKAAQDLGLQLSSRRTGN